MKKLKMIIFDMDGTLYDLNDLAFSNFNMATKFLCEYCGYEKNEAIKELNGHYIYPYASAQSRSMTAFFHEKNFDIDKWNALRSKTNDFELIDKNQAMAEKDIRFFRFAHLILLTNNTRRNVDKTLEHLCIDPAVFEDIICNENENKTADKKSMMLKQINRYQLKPQECLSIGDRYYVDARPMLELSGKAIILNHPSAIKKVIEEIDDLKSCDEYAYYE